MSLTRRHLFQSAGALGALGLTRPAEPAELRVGRTIYESIGVRPLINARGTITIISGSQTLPEVKAAMEEASRHYVHIDELMEAAGKRIAELTGAQSAIVTSGASGALGVATCACVTGGDPDKLELLANQVPWSGMKNQVIIPASSRNVYDHSVRSLGVHVVEPATMPELEAALGPQVAMVMLLTAAAGYESGPMSLANIAAAAHRRGIPVMADAAAENLTIPNIHLERGADLVGYSGGKCIRGPQCSGLLLGRRDLVQAAWAASAPHHTVCRGLKIGKEEIVGMLAAVEMWVKRDHAAEEKTWTGWLERIAARLKPVGGLSTSIVSPHGVDNRTPSRAINWDPGRIPLTEDELEQILWDGEPRIAIGGKGSFLPFPLDQNHAARISPFMMQPGDEQMVADRLFEAFSKAPKPGSAKPPQPAVADLSGLWDLHLEFVAGSADHSFTIEQSGRDLTGQHLGQAATRELKGTLDGGAVTIRTSYTLHGARLNFTFRGTATRDRMEGAVSLGEYGDGRWSATRHAAKFPQGGRAIPG